MKLTVKGESASVSFLYPHKPQQMVEERKLKAFFKGSEQEREQEEREERRGKNKLVSKIYLCHCIKIGKK